MALLPVLRAGLRLHLHLHLIDMVELFTEVLEAPGQEPVLQQLLVLLLLEPVLPVALLWVNLKSFSLNFTA